MGRHHRRNRSAKVTETKDRHKICREDEEKIKQSILEVFCTEPVSSARQPETRTDQRHMQKEPTRKKQIRSPSSSSDSPTESFRKKAHTKSSVKRQKSSSTSSKKQADKETAVARHLKVAHGFLHASAKECPKEKKMNAMCPGRLTRKVELLQKGKKSAAAKKGTEPQSTGGFVASEIQKLLSSAEHEVQSVASAHVDIPTSAEMDTVVSDEDHDTSTDAVTSANSSFAKKLDIRETIRGIMLASGLKKATQELYPDSDLLLEVTAGLQKLLVQNAPKDETPTSFPMKVKGRGHGSIQRSLTESFLSCQDDKDAGRDSHGFRLSRSISETESTKKPNHELPDNPRQEQTGMGSYEHSNWSINTAQKDGLSFYQQKDREFREKEIGRVHYDPNASSLSKYYRTRKESAHPRSDRTHLSDSRTNLLHRSAEKLSFPEKSSAKSNFCSERNQSNHDTGIERRQAETDNNLQLLYNTAKFLEQEYCMLEEDRSRLKDHVARTYRDTIKEPYDKSGDAFDHVARTYRDTIKEPYDKSGDAFDHVARTYRDTIKEPYDKSGDAFEAFFSDNRNDRCEIFNKQPQNAATNSNVRTGRDSPVMDAVSLLQAHEHASSVESMEVDRQSGDAIQLLKEHEMIENLKEANNRTACGMRRSCSDLGGLMDRRDSRNSSQCSDCSRLSLQLQIQQRDESGLHNYMAPRDTKRLCTKHGHTKSSNSLDFLDYVDHDQLARYTSDGGYSNHQVLVSSREGSQEHDLPLCHPFLCDVPQPFCKDRHSPWDQVPPGPYIQQTSDILRFKPLQGTSPVHGYMHPEEMFMDKNSPHLQKPVSPGRRNWNDVLGPLERPQTFSPPPTINVFSHPRKMY